MFSRFANFPRPRLFFFLKDRMWVLLCLSVAILTQGYVTLPASKKTTGPVFSYQNFTAPTTAHGHLATLHRVDHFHVYFPAQCAQRQFTSVQGKDHGCEFAVNGGPFSFNAPYCLGYIISDNVTYSDTGSNGEVVGLTKSNDWILGDITQEDSHNLGFTQLVSGFGWLTKNGAIVPPPGGEVAQRTFVGFNKQGEILIFQVDGYEKGFNGAPPLGLTLQQAAQVALSFGCPYAINFDGGGSSTAVGRNGQVINQPTCTDLPKPLCERPVTTILCIK